MTTQPKKQYWSSRLGIIFAVAGSAVGFGNFLRFPGLAAEHGGAAFMIAYFISLIFLGFPLCLIEWSLGRYCGIKNAHSIPALIWVMTKSRILKYFGCLAVLTTLSVGAFYLCLEAWTFRYAFAYLTDNAHFYGSQATETFFSQLSGITGDGDAFHSEQGSIIPFLLFAFGINFYLLFMGIRKGIEFFCRWAMPALLVISILMTIRVLTLDTPNPDFPQNNVQTGLAYMWEPSKYILEEKTLDNDWHTIDSFSISDIDKKKYMEHKVEQQPDNLRIAPITMMDQLKKPSVWLAAAGQLFFSLSIGYGAIISYASYLRRNDDIALSATTAFAANEFCEVGIGGLMTVPAAVAFLGIAGIAGQSTFSLAFNALPQVFDKMPAGNIFGILFFLLLSLAAVTSSISILQPTLSFFQDFLPLKKNTVFALLFILTISGASIVAWFSKGLIALEIFNFFSATLFPIIFALILAYLFGWKWGIERGYEELERGAAIRIPKFFIQIIKYISPLILMTILIAFLLENLLGNHSPVVKACIEGNLGAIVSLSWMLAITLLLLSVAVVSPKFKD